MGWWDFGIFGGDSPLDALGDIATLFLVPNIDRGYKKAIKKKYDSYMLCPIEDWSDERAKLIAKAIRSHWDEVIAMLEKYKDKEGNDDNVSVQVVAAVIMASGAALPKGFRTRAKKAGKNDEWANEGDNSRKTQIKEYIQAVSDYKTGNRIVLTSEGLFRKFAEAGIIEKGK